MPSLLQRYMLHVLGLLFSLACLAHHAGAQAINSGGSRVFVTGFTPVIGPGGGVGGVDVDVDGVLKRIQISDFDGGADLSGGTARQRAQKTVPADVQRRAACRKVSLSGLQDEVLRQSGRDEPLSAEVLYLAGLQRIEYVFVDPERADIVVAGPAEGWEIVGDAALGVNNRQATLRLDDLIDALQGNAAGREGEDSISCSIDPTDQGMANVQRLLRSSGLQMSPAVLREMERQLGDQRVTVTGVRPSSHFARVLVSADYMMKRIAMNLEPSGVADLPSYLQMLRRAPASRQVSAPRWWMATDYEGPKRTEDGLAFRFRGRGVKALSEDGYLNARGKLINARKASPLTQAWADQFTAGYPELSHGMPVFSQLRGCFDLALLAALIEQESLLERAGCPLAALTDSQHLSGQTFDVPLRAPSLASAVRGRSGWVVSVSGGVDVDTWTVLNRMTIDGRLSDTRQQALHSRRTSWWWD